MKKQHIISMLLALMLIIAIGIILKQRNEFNKVESTLFEIAVSNSVNAYNTYSIEESLNLVIEEKVLPVYHDGSSILSRDIQNISSTYQELYRYYVALYHDKDKPTSELFKLLQDSHTFFDYLGENAETNENLYLLPLEKEWHNGSVIIATIFNDLDSIRDEIYNNRSGDDRGALKELIIKNEDYAKTEKVQQYKEKVQQLIKILSETDSN